MQHLLPAAPMAKLEIIVTLEITASLVESSRVVSQQAQRPEDGTAQLFGKHALNIAQVGRLALDWSQRRISVLENLLVW
jgi:hypothetical protein